MTVAGRGAAVVFVWLAAISAAGAQVLPSEPLALAGGRVTLGADISATVGGSDPGFFNYTDYDHSALRMLRVDVMGSLNAGDHFAFLGELRSENVDGLVPYALYVRIRPWAARHIDIQAGRIPPTFGAFARRTYANDNPLIGYPLAYQYLTSLRPDSLPASADDVFRRRGSGWLTRFTIGDTTLDRGVPLVSAFRWDTGVQLHGGAPHGLVNAIVAVTTGTLSNPLFTDDNAGRQLAGRVEIRPLVGLVVGTSVARGPFVTSAAARAAAADGRDGEFTQTAWGGDLEYSRGHYLLRLESIVSAWRLPIVRAPVLQLPLRAVSTSVEGRYRLTPGLYAAARFDHLGFSDLAGTQLVQPWDAPVTRVEAGMGYSLLRNLQVKLSVQRNTRDGGSLERRTTIGAAQLVFWF